MPQSKVSEIDHQDRTPPIKYPSDRNPVFVNIKLSKRHWKNVPVSLTLHFSEVERDIGKGYIRFGVKRGDLDIVLKDAAIPFENNYLVNDLQEHLIAEIEINTGNRETNTDDNKNVVGFERNSPAIIAEDRFISCTESTAGYTEKFQETFDCVLAGGNNSNPYWTFVSKGTCKILLGGYRSRKMALMKLEKEECIIRVLFSIRPKDLVITHRDGIAANALSIFKEKILRILILKGKSKFGNKYCLCDGKASIGKNNRGGEIICQ